MTPYRPERVRLSEPANVVTPHADNTVWDSRRVERSLQEALYRNGYRNPLSKAAEIMDTADRHARAIRLARLYATDTDNPMSGQQIARLLLSVLTGEVQER